MEASADRAASSFKNIVAIFQTLTGEQGDIRIKRERKMPERAFSLDVSNPKGIVRELDKRMRLTYEVRHAG